MHLIVHEVKAKRLNGKAASAEKSTHHFSLIYRANTIVTIIDRLTGDKLERRQ